MRVYLMRHAWAVPQDPVRWMEDELRPLSAEGQQRMQRWAQRLVQLQVLPQVILCSPLLRAEQTAQILAQCLPGPVPVHRCPELAPGVELPRLLEAVQPWQEQTMLWVGHMPDVTEVAQALARAGQPVPQGFSPGALLVLEFEHQIAPAQGQVIQFLDPQQQGI